MSSCGQTNQVALGTANQQAEVYAQTTEVGGALGQGAVRTAPSSLGLPQCISGTEESGARHTPVRSRSSTFQAHLAPGSCSVVSCEQPQINRICHRTIARIVRVQMVADVISRKNMGRIRRITDHCIEVDHGVECAAIADP